MQSRIRKSILIPCIVLLLAGFVYGLNLKRPFLGTLSDEHFQWLTASVLKFSNHWIEEGPRALGFALYENPRSIEFFDLKLRSLYPSYPSGIAVVPFLIGRIKGSLLSPLDLHLYNLSLHVVLCLLFGAMGFCAFRVTRIHFGIVSGTLAFLFYWLHQHPFYWHTMVYGADTAILFPYGLIIVAEFFRHHFRANARMRTLATWLSALTLFYGALIDWFSFSIALGVVCFRMLEGPYPIRWKGRVAAVFTQTCIPMLVALGLFLLHVAYLGGMQHLLGMGGVRTTPMQNFAKEFFWWGLKPHNFILLSVLLMTFGYYIIRGNELQRHYSLFAFFLFFVPCTVHSFLFQEHSTVHFFALAKFFVGLALMVTIFAPLVLSLDPRPRWRTWGYGFFTCLAVLYLLNGAGRWRRMYPDPGYKEQDVAEYLQKSSKYEEVYYSKDIEIPYNPPQPLAISRKRVHKVRSREEAVEKLRELRSHLSASDQALLKGIWLERTKTQEQGFSVSPIAF